MQNMISRYFHGIWKEKNSGKLIEFVWNSGDDYLYFDEELVKSKNFEGFPISYCGEDSIGRGNVLIMQSKTFGNRTLLYILDDNTFEIENEIFERSEDLEGV